MTSSSPRKHPTTVWSRCAAALAALALAAAGACSPPRELFVTYFNGDHGVSLRHPATWRTDQAEQEGVWYRYFLAPPTPQNRTPVSVTLLAGPFSGTLDAYAERYLAGHQLASSAAEERQGIAGKAWSFAATGGATRYRLLLFTPQPDKVVGLYAQGDSTSFDAQGAALDEIWRSLTFERPERYPRQEYREQRASLGVPDSWKQTRAFSGGGTLLAQYVSPALASDKGRGTVHASLSVTFEAVPGAGGLDAYYQATRQKLGENFQIVSHASFKGGYVDVMRIETPLAASYVKRYYFAEAARACSLSFEARDDVYLRASRWADYIASTLQFGGAKGAPAAAARPADSGGATR